MSSKMLYCSYCCVLIIK